MSKNLNILTIYEYHNSSACISQNGKIMAAFNEDRFVKKKNEVSFPLNSIKACLKKAKLKHIRNKLNTIVPPTHLNKILVIAKYKTPKVNQCKQQQTTTKMISKN